jgi:hypothetical protein
MVRCLTNAAVLICVVTPVGETYGRFHQALGVIMKRLFVATAISAAILGSACAPSAAADLGPVYGKRHARTGWYGYNWRDRCAYAGYYCLYAYDGYVYHYPFDDRPSAHRWRRHRF